MVAHDSRLLHLHSVRTRQPSTKSCGALQSCRGPPPVAERHRTGDDICQSKPPEDRSRLALAATTRMRQNALRRSVIWNPMCMMPSGVQSVRFNPPSFQFAMPPPATTGNRMGLIDGVMPYDILSTYPASQLAAHPSSESCHSAGKAVIRIPLQPIRFHSISILSISFHSGPFHSDQFGRCIPPHSQQEWIYVRYPGPY